MIKKSSDGIVFDNTVYLSEESYRKFPIYMRLLQAFVIFVGSYCFMTIFTESFDLQFINSWLIGSIILSGLIFYAFCLYPRYDLIKIILTLTIYGGIAYYRYEQIKNGFFLLENAIIKRASFYYGFPEFSFIADKGRADQDITLFLIMIIIPVVAILTISLLRSKCKLLSYIIMLLPVVVSFTMGLTPPEADMVAYILAFLFILISNGFSHAKSSPHNAFANDRKSMIYRISIRSATIFCLLTLFMFFIVKQFVPVEKYKAYEGVDEAKTKIQSLMTDFSNYDITDKLLDIKWNIRTRRDQGSGGLSLGRLGRVGQVVFDESEHLQVTAPLQSVIEGIYLKGYIGSEYTGDSWKIHSRQIIKNYNEMIAGISKEEYDPPNASSFLLSHSPYSLYVNQGRIGIRYIKASKNYVYAPYFTTFKDKDGVSFEYDLGTVSDKEIGATNYDYSYNLSRLTETINNSFNMPSGILIQDGDERYVLIDSDLYTFKDYQKNESIYREFVYDTYTRLPEDGLDRLKHDFSREQVGPEAENIIDAIAYVKDYLNRYMRYTLSPGRLPRDKDFVEYFLYENKIGYCSHFASAGALMLRAMGYPSRYVEGYAINRSDLMNQVMTSYIGDEINTADIVVKDYNAHAWVEVYIDGFGWIPVEFTTGAGMEDMVDTISDIEQLGEVETEEELRVPTDIEPSPTVLPDEDDIPSPPAPGQDEDIKGSGSIKKDDDKTQTSYSWYLIAILLLMLLSSIIIFSLLMTKRRKEMTEESYSKKALRLYKRVERLFILNHGLPKKSKSLEENEDYVKEHLSLVAVEDFEACMDTVRKARFGRGTISPLEYMKVEHFYRTFRNRIYERLPLIKKAYFKITRETFD